MALGIGFVMIIVLIVLGISSLYSNKKDKK